MEDFRDYVKNLILKFRPNSGYEVSFMENKFFYFEYDHEKSV